MRSKCFTLKGEFGLLDYFDFLPLKGLFFDGHERRVQFNKIVAQLPPPTCISGQTEGMIGSDTYEKRLVMIYHDESSFHTNEGQSC